MSKSIFISGAAMGLGMALARKLAQQGWRVFGGVLPGLDTGKLTEGFSNITPIEQDVTDDASVEASAQLVNAALNGAGLDVLINNAGIGVKSSPIEGVDMSEAKRMFEVNTFGPIRVCKAFLPLLHESKQSPRIFNVTSGAVRVATPCNAMYNMSKSAVEGLTGTLRIELQPFGIQATSIQPGGMKTPMTANVLEITKASWEAVPAPVRQRYEAKLRPISEKMALGLTTANEPEYVADGIIALLEIPVLKPRYMVGKEVKMLPILQKLLPELTFEKLIIKQFFG
jgi:NAD(P)-dependent dehydrogenase (short-subunit alcohol dehydrogenase family)